MKLVRMRTPRETLADLKTVLRGSDHHCRRPWAEQKLLQLNNRLERKSHGVFRSKE